MTLSDKAADNVSVGDAMKVGVVCDVNVAVIVSVKSTSWVEPTFSPKVVTCCSIRSRE